MEKKDTAIDFKALMDLVEESDTDIETVIMELAMSDIPLSAAVIRLGVACGALSFGYKNGWSKEYI